MPSNKCCPGGLATDLGRFNFRREVGSAGSARSAGGSRTELEAPPCYSKEMRKNITMSEIFPARNDSDESNHTRFDYQVPRERFFTKIDLKDDGITDTIIRVLVATKIRNNMIKIIPPHPNALCYTTVQLPT